MLMLSGLSPPDLRVVGRVVGIGELNAEARQRAVYSASWPRMTVHDFLQSKGRRQLAQVYTGDAIEAAACAAAGIEVLVTPAVRVPEIRHAAPDAFLIAGVDHGVTSRSDADAVRVGYESLSAGADAVYCGSHDLKRIEAMAAARIPVIGHVGLVPYRSTWYGGMRAVGKTADEAMEVYHRTKAYENAGAIGVEMEVVPHQVAAAISRRTSIIVISMGSGSGCDGQYLFATDILGTNRGHYPRHAKRYRDLHAEYQKIQAQMREAFGEYKRDVESGAYPEAGHVVEAPAEELAAFQASLDQAF